MTGMLRSGACALAAVGAAALTHPLWKPTAAREENPLLWGALLLPFVTPVLATGYAYSIPAVALAARPAVRELLYGTLLLFRLTPLALLALHYSQPLLTGEAKHAARLAGKQAHALRLRFGTWAADTGRRGLAAATLVFLFAFSDMELASLLYIDTWTVRLFDAQVGGLPLHLSLQRALPAACIGLALVLFLLHQVRGIGVCSGNRWAGGGRLPGRWRLAAAWVYLVVALIATSLGPAMLLGSGLARGLVLVLRRGLLMRDIGVSLFIGSVTGGLGCLLSGWLGDRQSAGAASCDRRTFLRLPLVLFPGLLGALMMALLVLGLFSLPGLRMLRDSPLPLCVTLAAVCLPYALVLRLLLTLGRDPAALHTASLAAASPDPDVAARGRRLRRQLRGPGNALVFWATFFLAYGELTAAAILAPPGMTPVSVRLYNLMHYGQTPMLSAMTGLATAVGTLPLAVALLWVRRRTREASPDALTPPTGIPS